jgi:cytochrome o ubiquinol oxidase subunit IV
MSEPRREHGTTRSYIIGFVLSLVFTFIPYYLVVNQNVTGNTLLAAILGFAVLQMLVQILFFLHLGRGPKPLYNVAFLVSTVGIILVVVGGSIFIMSQLHYNMAPTGVEASKKLVEGEGIYQLGGEETGACRGMHTRHKVTIKDGMASPPFTTARLCDTLTFINEDDTARTIVFGVAPDRKTYGGEVKIMVTNGRPKTITLNEAGTHRFYDELQPMITGDFTVAPE